MYKLFLDKSKVFECNVKIEGASLNQSEVRLLLESDDFTLTFKGDIKSDGTVKIPINKLKGILKENYRGKISLEVIAEDTVFKPWESEYQTDVSKKVEVKFDSKVNESFEEPVAQKPKMTFSIIPDEFDTKRHINEIFKILNDHKVNKRNLVQNTKVFNKLVEKYCSLNYINDEKNVKSIKEELLKNIK
jgi:hypothetical protein